MQPADHRHRGLSVYRQKNADPDMRQGFPYGQNVNNLLKWLIVGHSTSSILFIRAANCE